MIVDLVWNAILASKARDDGNESEGKSDVDEKEGKENIVAKSNGFDLSSIMKEVATEMDSNVTNSTVTLTLPTEKVLPLKNDNHV